jgi:hypothetical protein
VHFRNKKQQFNTPDFMPVNLSNSVELVELEILQVGEKLDEQLSDRLANLHAVFSVAYIDSMTPHWFLITQYG